MSPVDESIVVTFEFLQIRASRDMVDSNGDVQFVKTFPEHPAPEESWRQFNKSCPFPATVPKRTTV